MELEKVYQKKTQKEHILIRPDTYVGSIEKAEANLWVKPDGIEHFELRKIEYVPGLFKIFDEIIVNAADNYQRNNATNTIKVWIDREKGEVKVYNNGPGIPVAIHKEHQVYIPEMIFGELLSGSNFNDTEKKVTGGRNGYGAKLTNIFSSKFVVETADGKSGKKFKMTWKDNMSKKTEPIIEAYSKEDFTEVTFVPDFKRFGIKGFDNATYDLFAKRVWDLAGVVSEKVKVFLNNTRIPVKNFKEYVDLYFGGAKKNVPKKKLGKNMDTSIKSQELTSEQENDEETKENIVKIYHRNPRWEVVVSISDGQFEQVSFVNSICTTRGGTHVNHVADLLVEQLLEEIKKKNKKLQIKPPVIKNNLWVFVNSLIENPAFDSQTKETLTTKVSNFGSKCTFTDKFFKELLATNLIEQIVRAAEQKEDAQLARALAGKKKSKLIGVKKLEDANLAGTKDSHLCTLILTEGDSAKTLAMAGIEIVGRDRFGVFPLKGKLLNVRDAKKSQVAQNEEIQSLIEILGLQVGKTYTDIKSLRYGSIMIMSDQDPDGSHIKGLVINFISHFWPSLFEQTNFLVEFVTPLLKCFGKGKEEWFYSLADFKQWSSDKDMTKWKVKYYKGLGTSTNDEGKEYFSKIDQHRIRFIYDGPEDREKIDMVFNEKRANDRKAWLTTYDEGRFVNHKIKQMKFREFVDNELIHFSVYDNMRSIPSMVDGFKPGQRKIIYTCFKRNLKSDIKVQQLSGSVSEHSAYHHGEASLQSTIVGLAQNFVGSNNINLLVPQGQFGSRANGGKDAASARYIQTNLSKLTRFIFPPDDDHIVRYLNDDGQMIEPNYYLPIIPMVLVNGAEGIGTGWSTNVPCFCPRDLARNILKKLDGESFDIIHPYYKNFKGEIIPEGSNYLVRGIYESNPAEDLLSITELPIGKWTRPYKSSLEEMMKDPPLIDDLREYHTTRYVHFEVRLAEGQLSKLIDKREIEKKFKLTSSISMNNMVLFDKNGIIKKYENVNAILDEFFEIRMEGYRLRKRYLLSKLHRDIQILENKVRFIEAVIRETLKIRNVKRKEIIKQLIDQRFLMMKDVIAIKSTQFEVGAEIIKPKEGEAEEGEQPANTSIADEIQDEVSSQAKEFNYLLSMALWSLSYEQVEKLKAEMAQKNAEIERLNRKTEASMWKDDLEAFLVKIDEVEEAEDEKLRKDDAKLKGKKFVQEAPKKKVKPKRKNDRSDDSSSDVSMDKPKRGASKKAPKTSVIKELSEESADDDFEFKPKLAIVKPKASTSDKQKKGAEYDLAVLRAKPQEELSLHERLFLLKNSITHPSGGSGQPQESRPNTQGSEAKRRNNFVEDDED